MFKMDLFVKNQSDSLMKFKGFNGFQTRYALCPCFYIDYESILNNSNYVGQINMIFFEFSLLQCNQEQCESVVRSSILRAQNF